MTNKRRTSVYCYGVSLGANILGLYLEKAGEKAKHYLDGALLYATPWSTKTMNPFFVNNLFGLYHKVIGLGLNGVIKTQLPQLKKVMTPEDYQWISNVLATNNDGLRHLDRHIYVKMFGYKDLQDYYDKVSLCNAIDAIKVPTFAFGAMDDNLCHDACIPRAKM